MRICPKCKKEQESSNFWKTCSYCKECQKENWRNRMENNKKDYSDRRKELWFKNKDRKCPNCKIKFLGKKRPYCSSQCCFLHQTIRNENGCLEWKGLLNIGGYGYFTDYSIEKRVLSHRYSYKIYKGEISNKLHVCHKCDNRKCCEPDHLFLGTDKENMQDCKDKGRTAKGDLVARRGEFNGNSKFTNEIVLDIRKMCEEGYKDRQIANKYNCSVFQVNAVRHRRTWKHI